MAQPANKKTSLQDIELNTMPDSPDKAEEEEGFTDTFSKWVRDRLKTGKKKMVEVEG
jgi:hypothetical protein